jgi:hypothetical protein
MKASAHSASAAKQVEPVDPVLSIQPRHTVPRVLGIAVLFSGAALLTHILAGASLRLGIAIGSLVPILAFAKVYRALESEDRCRLVQQLKIGVTGGFLATCAYDASRMIVTRFEPATFNPFEVIRAFGLLLAGAKASPLAVYVAGIAFHVLNGVCFGTAYWILFGRFGRIAGVAWGMFLEIFQITFYPGWLNIRFYREFVQVSLVSHLVYGAVLGFGCHWLAKRFRESAEPRRTFQ